MDTKAKDDISYKNGFELMTKLFEEMSDNFNQARLMALALDEVFKEFCPKDKLRVKIFIQAWREKFGDSNG